MNKVTNGPIEPSIRDTLDAISVLFRPGHVVELRAFGARGLTTKRKFTLSGYYNDFDRLAEDAMSASRMATVSGVYWTLQTIKPALLTRSPNRYVEGPAATTSDADVAWYSWLPVDVDPVRPSGVSATDAEKQKAMEVMELVVAFFSESRESLECAPTPAMVIIFWCQYNWVSKTRPSLRVSWQHWTGISQRMKRKIGPGELQPV